MLRTLLNMNERNYATLTFGHDPEELKVLLNSYQDMMEDIPIYNNIGENQYEVFFYDPNDGKQRIIVDTHDITSVIMLNIVLNHDYNNDVDNLLFDAIAELCTYLCDETHMMNHTAKIKYGDFEVTFDTLDSYSCALTLARWYTYRKERRNF